MITKKVKDLLPDFEAFLDNIQVKHLKEKMKTIDY